MGPFLQARNLILYENRPGSVNIASSHKTDSMERRYSVVDKDDFGVRQKTVSSNAKRKENVAVGAEQG